MTYYYVVDETNQVLTGPIELPVTPGIGVQVPGNVIELTQLLPEAEPGYVWVWRDGKASQLIDLRNRFVYRKDNGTYVYWTELGPLPDYLTAKVRPSTYYFWKDDDWVLDIEAERAGQAAQADVDRDAHLREVVIRVAPLQYAYDLGEATGDQLALLQAWKRYALNLARIEQQVGYPALIEWPTAPAKSVASPTV
ncbi:tail fiber assembly protein [Pseudomonas hamedanensis]|uniref:Tail fiber assembly protein n=1 Tax=Pseudomonas hamedanensis TaxID=2745504 RepID=A0A9E6P477_9PSED|nr:tail fiber assembly protein [Pseudomonas hamedanensis]QXI19620.1 tail fiber assembly protein [Pseudomonas hamedanensis]